MLSCIHCNREYWKLKFGDEVTYISRRGYEYKATIQYILGMPYSFKRDKVKTYNIRRFCIVFYDGHGSRISLKNVCISYSTGQGILLNHKREHPFTEEK
jgi:hypothetical protein